MSGRRRADGRRRGALRQHRIGRALDLAALDCQRAAVGERAAWRQAAERRHRAGDRQQPLAGHRELRQGGDQPACVGVRRVGQQRRHRPGLDREAAIQHNGAVAGLGDNRQIVRDQHHRHPALLDQLDEEIEDLALHGDVERRGRLVGDQQIGLAGERGGDHRALPLPARQLMRVGVKPRRRVGDADAFQQFAGALAGGPFAHPEMLAQGLAHLPPDGQQRVQRGHRLLEHHGDPAAAQSAHLAVAHSQQVGAVEADAAAHRGAFRQQPHHGERRHRLARTALADDAEALAGFERDIDTAQRRGRTRGRRQPHHQIGNFEQRHQRITARRGSSRSRRPSPSRLRPSTATAIAAPGKSARYGAW